MPVVLAGLALAVQAVAGSVSGVVRDEETGALLWGVTVLLVDLDRRATTDAEGHYILRDVPSGPQHVVIRRIGYESRTLDLLVPSTGGVELVIALRRDPVTIEPIEVHATAPLREVDETVMAIADRTLTLRDIQNSPLLSEPDVLQATAAGNVAMNPESPSGIHIHGGASDQVVFLLDGIPIFNPYHSAGTFSALNPDALAGLDLYTSAVSPAFPDALSGVVSARTRVSDDQSHMHGSVSTTQARATVNGPIGGGAHYLLSLRSAFAGLLLHEQEASHIAGKGFDWMSKLDVPLLKGKLELLGYGNTNEIGAAGTVTEAAPSTGPARNGFEWRSLSLGGGFTRPMRWGSWQTRFWRATAEADARWLELDTPPQRLAAEREDLGLVSTLAFPTGRARTTVGVRLERSRTDYQLTADSGQGDSLRLYTHTPISTVFIEHARPLTLHSELQLSLSAAAAAGGTHVNPGMRFRWRASDQVNVSASYARRQQFTQSMRNPESVVGNVFPADLFVGAGGGTLPVAVSDLVTLGTEYRPSASVRFGAQVYARGFQGVALVAPRDAGPFSNEGFVEGAGNAYGVALDVGVRGRHYALLLNYGVQHVHLEYGDTSYVPDHGATHALNAGVILFPTSTFVVKLGLSSLIGRRATAVEGPFEWEGCNLLDKGCEFAGSPSRRSGPLGATSLPAYHRIDLGIRKHWHLRMAGRDGEIAVFGTVTNLLDRGNQLTDAVDPATGSRTPVTMRPLSPLVVGIDWRF